MQIKSKQEFMQNNVFIVGNGFDLALGLPTRYSDFANSDYWPVSDNAEQRRRYLEQKKYISLEAYLDDKRNMETWFDLEQELYNYARKVKIGNGYGLNENENDIMENVKYFKLLQTRMCDYIRSVQDDFCRMHYDVTKEVLQAVEDNGFFNSKYSFNYTELPLLPNQKKIECVHLHGSIKDHSAILGVDEKPLRDGYETLMKTSSKYYKSHDLYNALKFANEVVIFGVSFGDIDYSYFDRFFKGVVNDEPIKEEDKKYITIFTKDDNSRMAIIRQLRKMEIDMQRLYAQSKLEFICVDEDNLQDKMTVFKERLKKNSQKNNPKYAFL